MEEETKEPMQVDYKQDKSDDEKKSSRSHSESSSISVNSIQNNAED